MAVGATHKVFAVVTMGTLDCVGHVRAVVAAKQTLRALAKRAVETMHTIFALYTALILGAASVFAAQLTQR